MNNNALQAPVITSSATIDHPVRVRDEWSALKEVIVGVIEDVRVPEWDPSLAAVIPSHAKPELMHRSGRAFDPELVQLARAEVDGLADVLEREGVVVRRPDKVDLRTPVVTPHFTAGGSFYSAMPRDGLFAIDDIIIESPMAWRSRYFEAFAYRPILDDYFRRGSRWLAAPRPQLSDDLWSPQWRPDTGTFESVITEQEPVFDAADFVRLGGGVILGQISHVTNHSGVEWLQRCLGPNYEVLAYVFDDDGPMHIDTTLLPVGPERVLVNRKWVSRLPDVLKDWEVLVPPPSTIPNNHPLFFTSKWIHCNVLVLNEQTVLVEQDETPLIEAFISWGFDVIKVPFKHFQTFGGSFHCATLDVRRDS